MDECDKRAMLRIIGKNFVGAAAIFFILWLVQMPFPLAVILPIGWLIAGCGSDIVRATRKGVLHSLGVALGIITVVFLALWMLQVAWRDILVYTTVIFLVVFLSEFIPRKKETGAVDLHK